MGSNYNALITVPATDGNFLAALIRASEEELHRALKHLTENPTNNKSRLAQLREK